jgi:tetratricopeptide (TPR) repeat protein
MAYKARKFIRRNRALVTGLAAVLAVLLAGIIVSLAFAVRAERARHEATIITDFLYEDVFEVFDGWDRGGQQITIKEFLDAASEKVSDKFGDMPLLEASIRKRLGDLYLKVDALDEAENHLRRSLEIFTCQVGRNDARTIEVVDLLGQMYWGRWQYQEAEKYLYEALPSKRRLLGDDHPNTLETMAWLGWACYGNGHAKKAEELLAEACTTAQRTLGEKDIITIECMLFYGGALILRGRYDAAERMLADALRLAQGVLDPNHPFFLYPAALLGRLHSREGRYQEAEKLLSNALRISQEAWGENNGGTFHNMAALAENYARQGLIDDAEKLMLDAAGAAEGPDGLQREIPVQTLTYLGFFYLWQKDYEDAERWASKALKASLESNGEGHPITFLPRMALGMVYREQGRYKEAESQLTKIVDVTQPDIADENVHIANVMHQLAALYQQQGRYVEAEEFHLRVLKIRRDLLVENHPHTLGTIRGLIALYTAWGKPQEARKWFAELRTAYSQQSAAHQYTRAKGIVNYDPATEAYTLVAHPLAPWAIEKELDFSYPEPTSEMWHVSDSLHFSYKTLRGDGSITAKIESIDPAHYGTKVGVMIRNTLEPASPNASVVVTALGDITFQYRTMELAATHDVDDTINRVGFPHWVRLTREASQFTAQHSSDGVNWQTVQDKSSEQASSIEISMDERVHMGLAITSGSPARRAQAHMASVIVTGLVNPGGQFAQVNDIGSLADSTDCVK